MNRIRNMLPFAALLVGAAVLGAPTQARANFEIRYSTDNGATFSSPVSDGGPGDLNSAAGVIAVDVDGLEVTATTSGGTGTSLTTIDLNVQSTGVDPVTGQPTPASTTTIVVQASMDELKTAPPPLVLLNRFTDDSIPSVTTTGESWVSTGDSLFTTAGATVVLDTGSIPPATAPGFNSYGPFTATSPYTVTEQISVSPYGAGSALNVDNNDRINPAPAPASLLLVLTGLPMLGLGAWLHRRRNLIAA